MGSLLSLTPSTHLDIRTQSREGSGGLAFVRALSGALILGMVGACGGGGGGAGGSLNILSCSLGCSIGSTNQAICGVTDIYVNQEIRISFSSAVDPTSVDNNTFQVADILTGKVPAATFSVDSQDPRILIYRPQLTFDSAGSPVFGLTEDASYIFVIPGQATGNEIGPFIRSVGGKANQTRMSCTLKASRGIFDSKPGAPRAEVFVDIVTSLDSNGDPDVIDFNQPAVGATDVWRSSDVLITFDDVMNPATLVNPVTGISSTVKVRIDPDGNISDISDQVDLPGVFSISIDQDAQVTTVTFVPDGGFPSAGTSLTEQRRIVVSLPDTIQDLGGNPIVNSGLVFFTPEVINFDPVSIMEDFETNQSEDSVRGGSTWSNGGILLSEQPAGAGFQGGGSGRLGDLFVSAGTTVVLSTDSEDFSDPVFDDLSVYDPRSIIDPIVFGQPLTVSGGVFEFANVQIDAGAILRFEGTNPARLLVRGEMSIFGVLDISGGFGADQDSDDFLGGLGGEPGAGGGLGGDGGARPDGQAMTSVGGVDNPNDPPLYDGVGGNSGGGIQIPNTLAPTDSTANGQGGYAWPQPTMDNPEFHFPDDIFDIAGMQFESKQRCAVIGPGGVGEGGGYALPGTEGEYKESFPLNKNDPFTPPPSFGGGDITDLMIDAAVRTLDPNLGYLRGGAGGGGAGGHLQGSINNGQILNDCTVPTSGPLQLLVFSSHSAAGGGGAGGGLQVQAGRRLLHNGILDDSGGDGGSFVVGSNMLAQGGGGGSGGGTLLQSPEVQIQNVPGRINVGAGVGGMGANESLGGDGGPGLVRIEQFGTAPDLISEAGKIIPSITDLLDLYGVGPDAILSTGLWSPSGLGPEGLSGAQSCWIRPAGNFFAFTYDADNIITGELGWDMRLVIDGTSGPQSYRGDNELFTDTLENVYGTLLGSAPVVVRFQGARVAGTLSDPCDVPLVGAGSPVLPGSLTGWVSHPSQLNDFFSDGMPPNIIRFTVIWDVTQMNYAGIKGVEDITFGGQPD